MHTNTDEFRIKIGKLVQSYIPKIFAMCEESNGELEKLMGPEYTKRKFGIALSLNSPPFDLSFCIEASNIPPKHGHGKQSRYWNKQYSVCGKIVRVTNFWYEIQHGLDNRPDFVNYLIEKEIVDAEQAKKLR